MSFEFLTKTWKEGRWTSQRGCFAVEVPLFPKHVYTCVCVCVCVCVMSAVHTEYRGTNSGCGWGAGAEEEVEQGCEMGNLEGKYWP